MTFGLAAAQDAGNLDQQINASKDADQLYQFGLRALADGQTDLAMRTLERVVGLRPSFAGAWLDLAIATSRSGDNAAAVEHLEYLRGQFVLPPAVALQVDYLLGLWQNPAQPAVATVATAAAGKGWLGEFSFGMGHDSNANAGPIRQQIPLSLAAGRFLFDVDSDFQPRADRFSQFGINLSGPAQLIGAGRVNPVLLLRSKQLSSNESFNLLDAQLGLQYQLPAVAGVQNNTWQGNLFVQHYRLGSQPLFNSLRVGVQRNAPIQACSASAGAEAESRYHQRVTSLGGTLYSASASLACALPGSQSKRSVSASLKTGFEHARADRAGGNNRSAELSLRYEQSLSATQSVQASWQTVGIADASGYSPLLESNAPRRINRQTVSVGLRQSLGRAWEARLNAEHFQQRSNLPLFEQQGSVLSVGLAWRFD